MMNIKVRTNISNDLYGYMYDDENIPYIVGIGRNLNEMSNVTEEGDIDYYAESGDIGLATMEHKYISRLLFKMHLDFGANVLIYLKYDYEDDWQLVYQDSNTDDKPKTLRASIIPQRHEHLRYKIEGTGNIMLYGIEYDNIMEFLVCSFTTRMNLILLLLTASNQNITNLCTSSRLHQLFNLQVLHLLQILLAISH